jgi:GDP-mannose 6-dehydrogenase
VIPHLFDLISNDMDSVVEESELLLFTQNKPEFEDFKLKYANTGFIDVV